MGKNKELIKVFLNSGEKEKIKKLAKDKRLSMSKFCSNILINYINNGKSNSIKIENEEIVDIHIKMNKNELTKIEQMAKLNNMSRSKFIAKASLENTKIIYGLKDFVKEINMLGSNLNQTVRLAHERRIRTIGFEEFNMLLARIIAYLLKIEK